MEQLWLAWPVIVLCALVGWPFFCGAIRFDTYQATYSSLYLLVYMSTGFYEEILCRGFIMTNLVRKWGPTRKGIYLP
jgi:membrane protease YdiL (CAAX protease family)